VISRKSALISGLGKCEREALKFIKENEPAEGYVLAFSGGKDSVVLLDLAMRSNVDFKVVYNLTTIDPPELVKFVRDTFKSLTNSGIECRILKPVRPYFSELKRRKFLPSVLKRWCCYFLKEEPMKRFIKNLDTKRVLVGIRREESFRRSQRERVVNLGYMVHYKPIFGWSEYHVWEYIDKYHILYCNLYDEGFSRLGCIVCPFHSPKLHQVYRKRYPLHYKMFENTVREIYENHDIWQNKYQCIDEILCKWYGNGGLI